MNEIEKMYKKCNIKKYRLLDRDGKLKWVYPPFTAEKQIKLVEFFISSVWWLNLKSLDKTLDYSLNFENKLARLVNGLWQDFTKEQQQQVKGILENNQ